MRIGIVNDTGLAREALRRVVLSSSEHEVAWTASDGAEAIALARVDRPDLILMDLFMPGVDGVEATRRIMGESPCAILVVTATVTGHLSKVYQAMGYGRSTRSTRRRSARAGRSPARRCSCTRSRSSAGCLASRTERSASRRAGEFRIHRGAATLPVERVARPPGCPGRLDRRPAGPGRGPRPAPGRARGRDHHRPARRRGVCSRAGPMALRAGAPARHADRGRASAGRRRDPALRHR